MLCLIQPQEPPAPPLPRSSPPQCLNCSQIAFYFDEDIQSGLAEALRIRGVNLLTTMEAGMIGSDDIHQLIFASENKRSLVSYNKRDFARLHYQWMSKQKTHQGIILSDQLAIGVVLRRLMRLYFSVKSKDMLNRLEYLGSWK